MSEKGGLGDSLGVILSPQFQMSAEGPFRSCRQSSDCNCPHGYKSSLVEFHSTSYIAFGQFNVMRDLLCLMLYVPSICLSQVTMPYNPDANDDGYIGGVDLLGLLPLYGKQFGIDSSLTCDYDGTPVEDWIASVLDGSIIVDSVLVQYHTVDSAQVYFPGCPDPVWETLNYERAWLNDDIFMANDGIFWNGSSGGFGRSFGIIFYESIGRYQFNIFDSEVAPLESILGSSSSNAQSINPNTGGNSSDWYIPFDTDRLSMDESGLHFTEWNGFLSGATFVNILPFWHYFLEGCTNPDYLEFNPEANDDDGSCFTAIVPGCLDSSYIEFNPAANVDDGSCVTLLDSEWECGDSLFYWDHYYGTVLIGSQCWFDENLRSAFYQNGDTIGTINEGGWASTSTSGCGVYDPDYCEDYIAEFDECDPEVALAQFGRHYNWHAAVDSRSLCPQSWHVPTKDEWTELKNHLTSIGLDGQEGTAMKATTGWNSNTGTNTTGFNAPAAGFGLGVNSGTFRQAGIYGRFWSATPAASPSYAWYLELQSFGPNADITTSYPNSGFSIRCLMDAE